VAHKDEKEQAEKAASCKSEPAVGQDDLENNVTTELSEVVRRAFDEDWTADPQESQIVDTQLIAHIDPIDDGALESGFLLKGRFEILELVHSGGMGHVYKATDRRRHPDGSGITHVAIKMMRPSVASRPEARFALEREATKAQALSHPNIINIFDFDEHDGQFFLVMEWLDGESVNSFLRRTSGQCLDPEIVWPIIEGAAAALQHAHDNNVVHADINPSNIFITDDQNVKLLDFGVAQFSGATEHPGDGELAWVTQTYSSPEVLSGHKPVYEDDVFSLGCIAYRMLSGRHPFGGSPSAIAKHKGIEVASIPELGDEYWDVLSRALSYERADRPHRVNDFFFRDVHASDADTSASRFEEGVRVPSWASWAVAAALAFVVIGWWLTKYAGEGGSVPDDEPQIQEPMISSAPEESVLSLVEGMLAAAQRALADGKLVSPDQDNARSFFNSLLVLEPGNEDALRGLRMISDRYVQQAHQALNADDPASAHTALTVATETDPENPAVAFVDQLLRAQGTGTSIQPLSSQYAGRSCAMRSMTY
jgi:serine/threonine protein kinase